jgi:hypothetical protein
MCPVLETRFIVEFMFRITDVPTGICGNDNWQLVLTFWNFRKLNSLNEGFNDESNVYV